MENDSYSVFLRCYFVVLSLQIFGASTSLCFSTLINRLSSKQEKPAYLVDKAAAILSKMRY